MFLVLTFFHNWSFIYLVKLFCFFFTFKHCRNSNKCRYFLQYFWHLQFYSSEKIERESIGRNDLEQRRSSISSSYTSSRQDLKITKQGNVARHAPTSSLFLTALSREYPPNPPCYAARSLYIRCLSLPFSISLDTSRYSFWILKLSRGSISPTRGILFRRYFATYFAYPSTRTWSKAAGSFVLFKKERTMKKL